MVRYKILRDVSLNDKGVVLRAGTEVDSDVLAHLDMHQINVLVELNAIEIIEVKATSKRKVKDSEEDSSDD